MEDSLLEDEIRAALCALSKQCDDDDDKTHVEEKDINNNDKNIITNIPLTQLPSDVIGDVIHAQNTSTVSSCCQYTPYSSESETETELDEKFYYGVDNDENDEDEEMSIELQFEEEEDISTPHIGLTAEENELQQSDPLIHHSKQQQTLSTHQTSSHEIHITASPTASSPMLLPSSAFSLQQQQQQQHQPVMIATTPTFKTENAEIISEPRNHQHQQMVFVQYFPLPNQNNLNIQHYLPPPQPPHQQQLMRPFFVRFPRKHNVVTRVTTNQSTRMVSRLIRMTSPVTKENITEGSETVSTILPASQSLLTEETPCVQQEGFLPNSDKPHKCKECGVGFHWSSHLKRHEKTHSNEKLECNICHAGFSQQSYFNLHRKSHFADKPYKCEECGKSFVQSTHLKIHIMIHTGEKPFQCDVCKARFTQHGNLKRHLRTHTGEKPYFCKVCPARFTHSSDLTRHVRIHTGERPYKCHHCFTSFATNGNLKSHLKIHTTGKGYKCTLCKASFNLESFLRSHMRTHTGERPFVCACGQSFTQGLSAKFHLKAKMSPACALIT